MRKIAAAKKFNEPARLLVVRKISIACTRWHFQQKENATVESHIFKAKIRSSAQIIAVISNVEKIGLASYNLLYRVERMSLQRLLKDYREGDIKCEERNSESRIRNVQYDK